jgi:cell shape-determining protein MreC
MRLPRLSSRRWFWILTGLALAWALSTTRLGGGNAGANRTSAVARSTEWPFRQATGSLVALPSTLLGKVQSAWARLLSTTARPAARDADYQKLLEENILLKREATIRLAEIEHLQDELLQSNVLHERLPSLSPKYLLPAGIYGQSVSVASGYCYLDKGAQDRVLPGGPVLLQFALLGRITSVGQFNCVVRLLTDRDMKLEARLVRVSPQGEVPVANLCIVHGNGNDTLRCDTIRVQTLAPREGDLLLLNDNEWPRAVQGAVIGQVREIRPNESQPLRYDLVIEPAVTIHSPGQVAIVLMNK